MRHTTRCSDSTYRRPRYHLLTEAQDLPCCLMFPIAVIFTFLFLRNLTRFLPTYPYIEHASETAVALTQNDVALALRLAAAMPAARESAPDFPFDPVNHQFERQTLKHHNPLSGAGRHGWICWLQSHRYAFAVVADFGNSRSHADFAGASIIHLNQCIVRNRIIASQHR